MTETLATFGLMEDCTMCGPLIMRIYWPGKTEGEAGLSIRFPQNISHEDFKRMKAEIRDALRQAEFQGEQKALAKIAAKGGG